MSHSIVGDFMRAVGASKRVFELLDRVPKMAPRGMERGCSKVNWVDDMFPYLEWMEWFCFGIRFLSLFVFG